MKPVVSRCLIGLGALCLGWSAQAFDYGDALKNVLEKNTGTSATTASPAGSAAGASASTNGAGIGSLTSSEMNAGLKEALGRGAEIAVAQLGQKRWFFWQRGDEDSFATHAAKRRKNDACCGHGATSR